MNVKTRFGAQGDGVTDDTAAIQAAITAGAGQASYQRILFFPKGTYLVSNQLSWTAWLTLQGENRDQTVFKLKDASTGYADPTHPRAVISTATAPAGEAFHNFIFDVTVDVGESNPGAVGISYLASNVGAIRNVIVEAPTGTGGVAGVDMSPNYPGPCLLKDVRVIGFSTGIRVGDFEASVTLENIDLVGQGIAGLSNDKNAVAIHSLTSTNTVPAIVNTSIVGGVDNMVTLVGATLVGGSSANPAIDNRQGVVYLRAVTTVGYRSALSEHGTDIPGRTIAEYTTGPTFGPGSPGQHSLDLPIVEPPALTSEPPSGWASIADYGALPTSSDNTAAIQAALDSGKPTVYFPPGQYEIRHTLRIGAGVHEILGFDSIVSGAAGDFATPGAAPLMRFDGTATSSTAVRQLRLIGTAGVTAIVDGSAGTLFLQDVHLAGNGNGYRNEPGTGPLFLEDVLGPVFTFANPQNVWARQWNIEGDVTKITNNGGKIWVLGLKSEGRSTELSATNGSSTEVLGAFISLSGDVPLPMSTPAWVAANSEISLIYVVQSFTLAQFPVQVMETRNGTTLSVQATALPARANGSFMPLYSPR